MDKKSLKTKRSWKCSPTQVILLGFLAAIAVGTLLLCLPFATKSREPAPFMDALFTATTSVCVTGLTTVDIAGYFSLFGHIVILILMQCGGLGIITFTTAALLLLRKKITLRDRIVLEEAFELNHLNGLLRFVIKVFKGTFLVESIGVVLSAIAFVPVYGPKGIWYALFHSVSSFCNAGMEILESDSLTAFSDHVLLNGTTMFLIVAGGLGFPVWWNIIDSLKCVIKEKKPLRNGLRKLSLHSKIVLSTTIGLILVGAAFYFFLEKDNPGTLGGKPLPQQLLMSVFQSVTMRTAGFYTFSQENLTDAGSFISIILNFIGGSPVGTAGGLKTTTTAVIALSAIALIRGRQETSIFCRTISPETIRKSLSVVSISIVMVSMAILALLIFEQGSFMDLAYEVISAITTIGLSRGVTPGLGVVGRIIIMICMYLGRTGPISLAIALGKKKDVRGAYSFPAEDIPVG